MKLQQLIDLNTEKFNHFKNAFNYPCVEQFKYLRGQYIKYGVLSQSNIDFMWDIYHTPLENLKHRAYMKGVWYDIKPKNIEYYNLVYRKQVQKCQFR
jgi:hypothetical protein